MIQAHTRIDTKGIEIFCHTLALHRTQGSFCGYWFDERLEFDGLPGSMIPLTPKDFKDLDGIWNFDVAYI